MSALLIWSRTYSTGAVLAVHDEDTDLLLRGHLDQCTGLELHTLQIMLDRAAYMLSGTPASIGVPLAEPCGPDVQPLRGQAPTGLYLQTDGNAVTSRTWSLARADRYPDLDEDQAALALGMVRYVQVHVSSRVATFAEELRQAKADGGGLARFNS